MKPQFTGKHLLTIMLISALLTALASMGILNRYGDGCHIVVGYRRHTADRRCGQCNRFAVRCADKRYDFQSGKDKRKTHQFLGQYHYGASALLLYCIAGCVCQNQRGKKGITESNENRKTGMPASRSRRRLFLLLCI